MKARVLWSYAIAAMIAACSSEGGGAAPPTSTLVGPAGGVAVGASNGLELRAPAGAVSAPVTITIVPTSAPVPGALGQAYEIGPHGTQFQTPVTLVFRYRPEDIGDRAPSSLTISTLVAGAWQPIDAVVVDAAQRQVSGTTRHLSLYAITALQGAVTDAGVNDPDCPQSQPTRGDFCQRGGLSCEWLSPGGDIGFAYCDGSNWWTSNRPAACPARSPRGSNQSCGTFNRTCGYPDAQGRYPGCFEYCNCTAGQWNCVSPCRCSDRGGRAWPETEFSGECLGLLTCGTCTCTNHRWSCRPEGERI